MPKTVFPLSSATLSSALTIAAGLAVLALSRKIGWGTASLPGPGLWPAAVGAGLLICGLTLPLRFRSGPPRPTSRRFDPPDRRSVAGLVAACGLWLALLLPLGWIAATGAALITACRSAGDSPAETAALLLLVMGGLYLGISVLLGYPLPGLSAGGS